MNASHEGVTYKIGGILDRITYILSISLISTAGVALVAWPFVMTAYIIVRRFEVVWLFVEEFTAYLMVLTIFLALSYTVRAEGHIRIDVVTRLLSRRTQDVLEVATLLISLIVTGYLTQKGVTWFLHGLTDSVRSEFPSNILLWPVYLLAPVGLSALGLALLCELYRSIVKLAKGRLPAGENKISTSGGSV